MFFRRAKKREILLTEVGSLATGDQGLLVAVIRRLRQAGYSVTILQRVAMDTVLRHAGIRGARLVNFHIPKDFSEDRSPELIVQALAACYPNQYAQLQSLLFHADVLCTVPGGRMMDGYALPRNLVVSFVALQKNVPVINLHQSYGPVTPNSWRELVRRWAQHSRLNVARDERSLEFLNELGVDRSRVQKARDLMFAEQPVAVTSPPMFDLGVNLRFGFNAQTSADAVGRFLREYQAMHPNARVLMYTTTNPLSLEIVERVRPWLTEIRANVLGYPSVWATIANCALHVSDSFHGIVFCAMLGRPVVTLQPDFQAWKLEGTTAPGVASFKVLGALSDDAAALRVAAEVREVEEQAGDFRERLLQLARYGREMAEEGWRRVIMEMDKL